MCSQYYARIEYLLPKIVACFQNFDFTRLMPVHLEFLDRPVLKLLYSSIQGEKAQGAIPAILRRNFRSDAELVEGAAVRSLTFLFCGSNAFGSVEWPEELRLQR